MITSWAGLDEWHLGGQAQPIDVTASRFVVESVENERELFKIIDRIFRIHDRVVMGYDLGLIGLSARVLEYALACCQRLGFAHVMLLKQKLTIQIAQLDRIQVDLKKWLFEYYLQRVFCLFLFLLKRENEIYHFHFGESRKNKILEQLTTDSARSNHQKFAISKTRIHDAELVIYVLYLYTVSDVILFVLRSFV